MTGKDSQTDYRAILETAKKDLLLGQEELGNCLKKQEELEKWITGLRQTVAALSRMLGEEFVEEDAMGLTDAIRQVFLYRATPMIPTEVRDALESSGYNIQKYGNVMASVHSVINRLKERAEIVEAGTRADGKTAYKWKDTAKTAFDVLNRIGEMAFNMNKKSDVQKVIEHLSATARIPEDSDIQKKIESLARATDSKSLDIQKAIDGLNIAKNSKK